MKLALLFILICASIPFFAHALEVKGVTLKQIGRINGNYNSGLQWTNNTYCFSHVHDAGSSFVCSFDGGNTFSNVADASGKFCGSSGAVVEEKLICNKNEEAKIEEDRVTLPSYVFTPSNGVAMSTGEPTVLTPPTNMKVSRVEVGGSTYVRHREEYFRVVTFVGRDENEEYYQTGVLRSTNGLQWDYVSDVPFETRDPAQIFYRGVYVGVSSGRDNSYKVSYYNDKYEKWSSIAIVNSSALPFASTLPSGLVAEAGTHNDLQWMNVKLSLSGVPIKNIFSVPKFHNETLPEYAIANETEGFIAGVFPVLREDAEEFNIVYEHCPDPMACNVFLLTIQVNDSEELKMKEKQLEEEKRKEEERKKKMEEEKARRKKIQEQREKARQEKKKKFEEYDAPFIASANKLKEKDGEFIVVRQGVKKQYIEFEKETFFD